jgi:hypothetical protein
MGPSKVTSPEDGNRSSFRIAVFSSIQNSGEWTKSRNPVVVSVIHHRQNPSDPDLSLMLEKYVVTVWNLLSAASSGSGY